MQSRSKMSAYWCKKSLYSFQNKPKLVQKLFILVPKLVYTRSKFGLYSFKNLPILVPKIFYTRSKVFYTRLSGFILVQKIKKPAYTRSKLTKLNEYSTLLNEYTLSYR